MGLPIPDIMERTSNVLKAAENFVKDQTSANINLLAESLKKVSPEDLLAVMNEIGQVYVGMHNIQVKSIGFQADPKNKKVVFGQEIEFGIGPRNLLVPFEIDQIKGILQNLQAEISKAEGGAGIISEL